MGYKVINETKIYKMAFELAMNIFELSKRFPKEETHSLTDQIRRSSRSVCSCLAEAHRKRLYPAHFVSKVSDADMENAETQTWLKFAFACRYMSEIEKLYLRYRFQKTEAGQKIAEIYSPELLTAQENLLFLLKNDAQNISFINAARQKLLLLGMSAMELHKVIASGKPLYSVSIYSNYSGLVHDADMTNSVNAGINKKAMENATAVTQELSLKEGMYVTKGQTLFMIMNHQKAWVALQIFPNQQSVIKKGDAVTIIPETDTTAIINGAIDFIEPFFRGNSKTLTARVYFHNMNMLTIGSQVTANISTGTQKGLWVPQTAVLSLGQNQVAFLKSDGGFAAHKVTTGIRAGNKVQIIAGLHVTDTVAANAQYLVDSESFIKVTE